MSHKLTYEQFLQKIQRRASEKAQRRFRRILRRQHIRIGMTGLFLIMVSIAAYLAGLTLGATAALLVAIPVIAVDIRNYYLEWKYGFCQWKQYFPFTQEKLN